MITPFFNRFLDNHIRTPAFGQAGPIISDNADNGGYRALSRPTVEGTGPVTSDGGHPDTDGGDLSGGSDLGGWTDAGPPTPADPDHDYFARVMGRAGLALMGAMPGVGVLLPITIALASNDSDLSDHAAAEFIIGIPANLLGTGALTEGLEIGNPALVAVSAVGLVVSGICTAMMPVMR